MNFATNPTTAGLSDRADQWFLSLETDATGAPTYEYGTAVRNTDGTLTYTNRGAADSGSVDLAARAITIKVNIAKLNALQTRGVIDARTVLIGLRGSASLTLPGVATPISDSTRGGRTTQLNKGCTSF